MEPKISVVVPTRNRGPQVLKTVETILANDYPGFETTVVDQSDDDLTRDALQVFFDRPHFTYLRTARRGLSAARNEGIASTESELIAMTDDDCQVAADWLREIVAGFCVDKRVGVVFGNVLAALHDHAAGFIPAYSRAGPFLAKNIFQKHRVEGIGACMGLRRSTWQALYGFDENLGAGGRFGSAEELDFAVRALLAGYAVYETPKAQVVHNGFRTWASGKTLIWGYLYGIGAMFAKNLKAGHLSIMAVLWCLAWRWAFQAPIVNLGRRPPRLLRINAFLKGFIEGMRFPIDRHKGHYAAR